MNNAREFWKNEVMPNVTMINKDAPWYAKPLAWVIILVILLAAGIIMTILLWPSVSEMPSTKKQYEDKDKTLEDDQEQIEREMAEAEEKINEDIKKTEARAKRIDRADTDELLAIYDELRAEHLARNAASQGDE